MLTPYSKSNIQYKLFLLLNSKFQTKLWKCLHEHEKSVRFTLKSVQNKKKSELYMCPKTLSYPRSENVYIIVTKQ